jgi:hypothetical protein
MSVLIKIVIAAYLIQSIHSKYCNIEVVNNCSKKIIGEKKAVKNIKNEI